MSYPPAARTATGRGWINAEAWCVHFCHLAWRSCTANRIQGCKPLNSHCFTCDLPSKLNRTFCMDGQAKNAHSCRQMYKQSGSHKCRLRAGQAKNAYSCRQMYEQSGIHECRFVLARLMRWLLAAVVGQSIMLLVAKRFWLSQEVYGRLYSGTAPVLVCLDRLGDMFVTLPFFQSYKGCSLPLGRSIRSWEIAFHFFANVPHNLYKPRRFAADNIIRPSPILRLPWKEEHMFDKHAS